MIEVPDQIEALARAWENRDAMAWRADRSRFASFGRKAVALGSPALGFDILSEARTLFPADPELRYLSALALAKGGSSGQAARLLRDLMSEDNIGSLRPDVLSLAGRVAKDRWARLPVGRQRDEVGAQARLCYLQAFESSRDHFPGINAATMSVLTGQKDDGRRIAAQVRTLCQAVIDRGAEADLWAFASLGEACLLLGDDAAASAAYRRAHALAGNRHGDIASMRRQARLLLAFLPTAKTVLEILQMPRVAVLTGHMIDAPGRATPRFPAHLENAVAVAIEETLAHHNVGFGFCSAACGADILFAEQLLAGGGHVEIVLPFSREDFIRTSVAFAGSRWVERFDRLLERAAAVTYCVEENHLGDDVLFAHAAELTAGMAMLRTEQLESEALMLAVAEPGGETQPGGTLDNVQRWKRHGRNAQLIDLASLRATAGSAPIAVPDPGGVLPQPNQPQGLPWGGRKIMTMLFADMVGYSKLREHETPLFFVHFLGAVERELNACERRPAFGNTWGDGLYLVFDDVGQGADFALRLRDAIADFDWVGAGLPVGMNIRIGMHTGPVFRGRDPIIGQESFFGSHVTRAARIEPVAAEGSIYVSEQMAAALAARADGRFTCDYLGPLSFAKQYGSGRFYRLRRAREVE
jgi:class 3 adenylate cyclase